MIYIYCLEMNKVKTYSDIQNEKQLDKTALELFNEIYEKLNTLSEQEIKYIAESANTPIDGNVESIENEITNVQNEGFVGGLVGGLGGLIAGDKLGKAICQALGVTTGPLYSLLTSKLVMTAICTYLGIKM